MAVRTRTAGNYPATTRESLVAKLDSLNEAYSQARQRRDNIACYILMGHIDVTKEMIKELDK